MDSTKPNPLMKYFRAPGIHITLPSKGRFFKEGEVELTINGEIPVYPMTAADEIMLKNPDALLNGYAIEKLLESCVPAIANVRRLPTQDVDVLLLAIKLCSYGDELATSAECPKCKHENDFMVSIRDVLSRTKAMDDEYMVRIDDEMVVYLRPYDMEANTKINMAAFEEAKLFQNLVGNQEVSEDERVDQFNKSFEKITALNLDLMARCIERVVIPEGDGTIEITDETMIRDFIRNAERSIIKKIQTELSLINQSGVDKIVVADCDNQNVEQEDGTFLPCEHKWEAELTFDPSHFFE